jgi:peptidyl-prolyl cis-trans isomerase B (cyclophilin B)
MKLLSIFLLSFFLALPAFAQEKKAKIKPQKYDTLVTISTTFGDIKLILYEDTPKHRTNFLKLVGEKFYDGLLFHRVINNFMIQGGDPNSRNAKPDQMLGSGGSGERIPAEFLTHRIHKKGTLAAARDGNPQKASSNCQFYLVQGKTYSDSELQQRSSATYTPEQIEIYKKLGGTPFLDMNYTVFGEVVEGLAIIDEIAKQPTGNADRPQKDVQMRMSFQKMKKTDITKKYGFVYPEFPVKTKKPKKK